MRLVTADDVCLGAKATLVEHVPTMLERLVDDEPDDADPSWAELKPPATWEQVPDFEALQEANFPAGALTIPDTVEIERRGRLGYDVTWRLAVAVYDRGGDYHETARRARRWAAVIRAVLLDNPTLGGVATSLMFVTEQYRQVPQPKKARTLGGCAVGFDVTIQDIVDVAPPLGPPVQTVHRQLTVRTE